MQLRANLETAVNDFLHLSCSPSILFKVIIKPDNYSKADKTFFIIGASHDQSLISTHVFLTLPILRILIFLACLRMRADMGIAKVMEHALALPDRNLDTESAVYSHL